jgi:WhiB family redox-sensing transcriptional regulator
MGQIRFDAETWMVAAKCLGHTQLFFAPDESESRAQRNFREAQAKAVCRDCVVLEHCLDEAMRSDERFGIWGGLTERERRSARRNLAAQREDARPAETERAVRLPAAVGGASMSGRPNGS